MGSRSPAAGLGTVPGRQAAWEGGECSCAGVVRGRAPIPGMAETLSPCTPRGQCQANMGANTSSANVDSNASSAASVLLGGSAWRGREPFSIFTILILTLLVLLTVATFLWNLLVLATILRVKAFHRVPHNLVASTAVSDVLVAALVMPLSLVKELSSGRRWRLGRELCLVWVCFDVLCCTASIWNVTAIALDRYWSISRHLEYTLLTRRRISNVMIALTWALSAAISLAPLFGWGETYSPEQERCQVSQEPSYTIVSTGGAFYLPLCVVLFVYWKIYKAAKFRVGGCRRNTVVPLPAAAQVRVGDRKESPRCLPQAPALLLLVCSQPSPLHRWFWHSEKAEMCHGALV